MNFYFKSLLLAHQVLAIHDFSFIHYNRFKNFILFLDLSRLPNATKLPI